MSGRDQRPSLYPKYVARCAGGNLHFFRHDILGWGLFGLCKDSDSTPDSVMYSTPYKQKCTDLTVDNFICTKNQPIPLRIPSLLCLWCGCPIYLFQSVPSLYCGIV